jgi:hypothetical protein
MRVVSWPENRASFGGILGTNVVSNASYLQNSANPTTETELEKAGGKIEWRGELTLGAVTIPF